MKPLLSTFPFTSVRHLSTSRVVYAAASGSAAPAAQAPPNRRVLVNEDIARRALRVRLVDPKTGSLAGPFSVRDILSRMDKNKFRLQQVVAAVPTKAGPEAPIAEQTQYPICKLIDKKEEYDKHRIQSREAKAAKTDDGPSIAPGTQSKEFQISWAVSQNDLSHKLSKAKKELLRGARIIIVISQKSGTKRFIKGQNKAEEERRDQMLQSVEEHLCKDDQAEEEDAAPIAKRLGEIDWQKGGSAAILTFERIRR